MDELLQKLLEAEVLTEETKTELQEALKTQLKEAEEAAKEQAAADVRAELTEQWLNDKDELIEAIDSKVGEYLTDELNELKEDIERFRDLDAEYAEKLVEAKAAMKDEVKHDIKELVEKLDAFLEIRLTAELEELKEDIDAVRQNEFGRRIFEAFVEEFTDNHSDNDSAEATLRETKARLQQAEQALEEAEQAKAEMERKIKLENLLEPLAGRQREVMEAILKNVHTDNLEQGYNTFIGRVLKETDSSKDATSEKEDKVLAEGEDKKDDTTKQLLDEDVVVKEGNKEPTVIEESDEQFAKERQQQLSKWQRLAGIEKK